MIATLIKYREAHPIPEIRNHYFIENGWSDYIQPGKSAAESIRII